MGTDILHGTVVGPPEAGGDEWDAAVMPHLFALLDESHAFHDTSKDNVLAIEVLGLAEGDEELRAICILAGIRH